MSTEERAPVSEGVAIDIARDGYGATTPEVPAMPTANASPEVMRTASGRSAPNVALLSAIAVYSLIVSIIFAALSRENGKNEFEKDSYAGFSFLFNFLGTMLLAQNVKALLGVVGKRFSGAKAKACDKFFNYDSIYLSSLFVNSVVLAGATSFPGWMLSDTSAKSGLGIESTWGRLPVNLLYLVYNMLSRTLGAQKINFNYLMMPLVISWVDPEKYYRMKLADAMRNNMELLPKEAMQPGVPLSADQMKRFCEDLGAKRANQSWLLAGTELLASSVAIAASFVMFPLFLGMSQTGGEDIAAPFASPAFVWLASVASQEFYIFFCSMLPGVVRQSSIEIFHFLKKSMPNCMHNYAAIGASGLLTMATFAFLGWGAIDSGEGYTLLAKKEMLHGVNATDPFCGFGSVADESFFSIKLLYRLFVLIKPMYAKMTGGFAGATNGAMTMNLIISCLLVSILFKVSLLGAVLHRTTGFVREKDREAFDQKATVEAAIAQVEEQEEPLPSGVKEDYDQALRKGPGGPYNIFKQTLFGAVCGCGASNEQPDLRQPLNTSAGLQQA